MSGAYAPFKRPRPSGPLDGPKIYKDRTSVLSPRPSPPQPASAPVSSFYGAASSSSQGGTSRGNGPWGAGGTGFNPPQRRTHDGGDLLLDGYGVDLGRPPSSSAMRPGQPSHTAFEHRPPRPVQRPAAQPSNNYPWKKSAPPEPDAESLRKQQQEADEVDPEAQQRAFDESERLARTRREALAAARKKPPATASSADPPKPRPKTSVELVFDDQKARTKPKGKDKGEEARERAKERRSRGKDKVKKKRVALESDIEDSADDHSPRRKPSSSTSSSRKLGSLRGQFDTAPPRAASPSSSPEVVAEALPTLEEMHEQERAAERKRDKGKGRARDVEEDAREVERVRMDMERGSREETQGWDALLDVDDDALPDSSTLCPFCDAPLPDTPSPRLLATRAALLRHPHDRRPTLRNKDAVRYPEGEHVVRTAAFCKMHKDERTVVPEGRARGYPTRIRWDELPRRIDRELGSHLRSVIFEQTTTPFLERALAAWQAGEWKSVLSEYGSFDIEEPGYYGPRGLELIKHTLSDLFVDKSPLITPRRTAPLSVDFYLRRVLVPECAVELIRADLAAAAKPSPRRDGETPRAQAERVRGESRAYGRAVFPHEGEAEERREAAAAPAPTQVVVLSEDRAAGGTKERAGGRSRDVRERDDAQPLMKRRRTSSSSSSSSSGSESDDIEVVERARAPASSRTPKVVVAAPVRAPTAAGGFRVPKAQGQARSAAASTASSTSSSAPASAAAPGRKLAAGKDESDSDDELVIVSAPPLSSSPSKEDKKKKNKKDKERKHKDQARGRDMDRKKHKKVRRSSPASSPALGLFPPSSPLPSSSLALGTSPPSRQTDLDRLKAALNPAADDELAEVDFRPGSFARDNRKREAREKKARREKKKRERARKMVKGGRGSSSSSSDEG